MYKKSAPKKSGTSRNSTKRKASKSRKSKVYIPASKVIVLCLVIIALCMGLLLITTEKTRKPNELTPISQRFEQEEADNSKGAENKTKPADNSNSTANNGKSSANKSKTTAAAKPTPEAKTQPAAKSAETKTTTTEKSVAVNVKPPAENIQPVKETKVTPKKEESKNATSKYNFPKAVNGAQLIFVFDDAGQNNAHLEKFMSLPFPITVAVLPQLPSSVAAADRVRRSGNEVILHQPMQSISDKVNPGPGAITPDMDEAQIITQLFLNINEVGPVAGMNNHEGSAITADAEKMAIILQTASENGIYFLDSRTNVETKVPYVAGELGYSYYERNIFLDNEKTEAFALKELRRGLDIANKNGNVIMIGHIWSADFLPAFLNKVYPELKAAGYTFSTVGNSRAQK